MVFRITPPELAIVFDGSVSPDFERNLVAALSRDSTNTYSYTSEGHKIVFLRAAADRSHIMRAADISSHLGHPARAQWLPANGLPYLIEASKSDFLAGLASAQNVLYIQSRAKPVPNR